MQPNLRLLLLLAIGCGHLNLGSGRGYMTVQFLQYNNHDSRCADGTFCDTFLFFNSRESACDPMFRLTADKSNPGGTNLFDYQQTSYYDNQDVINFGSTFGSISNPVIIAMNYDDNPGSIQMTVTVLDKDTSVNDLIDIFSASLTANGPEQRSVVLYSQPMVHSLSIRYWYTCHSNYYGPTCNTYCLAQDDALNGHYTCDANGQKVCRAGWIGAAGSCKTPHPCNTGICQHGAACIPQGEGYKCDCPADYAGTSCEQFLNPCEFRNPCKNGARCYLGSGNQPQCSCTAGFTGAQCDQDVNECAGAGGSSPCSNGMPCLNTYGGFSCNCIDPHFKGSLCELQVCNGTVCYNNGTCSPGSDRVPRCVCAEGFTGDSCQTNVDDCASSPCQNGSTCRDLVADFACDCPIGFAGRLCEQNVNDCASSPCQNGATCRDLVADFACDCPLGFTGRLCEQNVDDCGGSPCRNGGTCADGVASFSCTCRPGYSGRTCERPPAAPNVTADLLVGEGPVADASGASVSVAGVAAGSSVGFLLLVAVAVFLGVYFLRNRDASSQRSDDASSGAFSNAVYHNADSTGRRGSENSQSSTVAIEDEANAVYEVIGGGSRVNQTYEVEA